MNEVRIDKWMWATRIFKTRTIAAEACKKGRIGLIENRVGAKLVPNYLENVTTPDQYEILEMNRISGFVNRAKGLGRPTKKDRRELEQFTEPEFMDDGFDFEFDFGEEDEE